jgi:hypothetical protein
LALEARLFGFDLRMKTLTECAANLVGVDEAASGGLVAWDLPPLMLLLKRSSWPSTTSPFDEVARGFFLRCIRSSNYGHGVSPIY